MNTEAARAAAAMLTDELLEDMESSGGVTGDAARQVRAEMRGGQPPEPTPAPAPSPPAAPTEETQTNPDGTQPDEEEPEAFELNPARPEGLDDFLDEPDFAAEVEAELAAQTGEEEYEYEDDERVVAERRKRIAAEKRAQHFEQLRARDQKTQWVAEAEQYFPLSRHAIPNITATSRKAFLREARDAHEAVRPYVEEYLTRAQKMVQGERAVATEQARAEVQQAWGKPTTGPGVAPVEQAERAAVLDRARKTGSLEQQMKALLQTGYPL